MSIQANTIVKSTIMKIEVNYQVGLTLSKK